MRIKNTNQSQQVLESNRKRALLIIQNLDAAKPLWFNLDKPAKENESLRLGAYEMVQFDAGVSEPVFVLGERDQQFYVRESIYDGDI